MHPTQSGRMVIGQTVRAKIRRRLLRNSALHAFLLKHYLYADAAGGAKLRRVARRLHDPRLRSKVEIHAADEERHADLFRQLLVDMAVPVPAGAADLASELLPGVTERLQLIHSEAFGLSEARLDEDKYLEPREVVKFLVFMREEEKTGFTLFSVHLHSLDHDTTIRRVLEAVLVDERRHIAYLTEELDGFGQRGLQPYIDELCRYRQTIWKVPLREAVFGMLPAILELFNVRPARSTARLLRWLSGAVRITTKAKG